jgi:hypothetical protein
MTSNKNIEGVLTVTFSIFIERSVRSLKTQICRPKASLEKDKAFVVPRSVAGLSFVIVKSSTRSGALLGACGKPTFWRVLVDGIWKLASKPCEQVIA